MSSTNSLAQPRDGTNLGDMFGVASLIVILGVMVGWVILKQTAAEIELDLPPVVTALEHRNLIASASDSQSLVEMAELAFAAGRIAEPEFDSALGYYTVALEQDPSSVAAAGGIARVVSYLLSQAETALFRNDWETARKHANVVLGVQPRNAGATEIMAKANRSQRVQQLTERALAQFSNGRLVSPAGDNAAQTYQEILGMDPGNQAATQGLNTVVQRLMANAQSAAIAGDTVQAERFMIQVRALDPRAAGLAETERSTRQVEHGMEDGASQQDLIAASAALQEDRLMPPEPNNAYDLFKQVLQRSPDSEAAQRGIGLVRAALIDRTRAYLTAGNIVASEAAFADAERAGVAQDQLAALRAEIGRAERLASSRAGQFDRVYSIKDLKVLRQVAPNYPPIAAKRGSEGWVDVEFTVTETGEVRDPQVIGSSSTVFDRAAIMALNRWLFEPVNEGGEPVPVRARLRFSFRP